MSDVNPEIEYQQQQAEFLIWISKEITEANERLPIDVSQVNMPLDVTIRSIALTVAQRHCGDTTVKEGNLYQQLKMDNKLVGPLTVEHVLHCALVFEMYLWGKWSKDIAGRAMEATLGDLEKAIKGGALDKHIDELVDEPPTRPHSGGEG
jgi:hypothetical protein